ncbi:MAG: hypothetical protein KKB51_10845 [Candidatus Riflebacteria bacterium]|nr:hypothetical protein [Candidatus Riflebacteria bacterium]
MTPVQFCEIDPDDLNRAVKVGVYIITNDIDEILVETFKTNTTSYSRNYSARLSGLYSEDIKGG